MDQQIIEILAGRLNKLERENWRLKVIGAVALGGIVALVAMGQSSCNMSQVGSVKVAKVIEAEQFILKDRKGRKRAALQMDVLGPGGMGMEYASGLFLYDEEGKERIHLMVDYHGISGLAFYNKDGKHIANLFGGRNEDGSDVPSLTLSNGKEQTELRSNWFVIAGAGGAARLRADESNDGVSLSLNGRAGAAILSSDNDTGVSLKLNGKEGYSAVLGSTQLKKTTTGTVEKRPESSLVLFNRDDKVIWSAPR